MGDRLHELAMLKLAGRASVEESCELDDLLADNPEFRAEYELLQKEVPAIKELIPMMKTPENSDETIPEYAKTALLAEIGEIFGDENQAPSSAVPEQPDVFPSPVFWKWSFGLAFLAFIVATASLWNLYNTNQALAGEKRLLTGQLESARKELSDMGDKNDLFLFGANAKYRWDFGDNRTKLHTPHITFSTNRDHTVSLSITAPNLNTNNIPIVLSKKTSSSKVTILPIDVDLNATHKFLLLVPGD